MHSGSNRHSEFESHLERALLARSQTVFAPRMLFDRIENRLGDQDRRSLTGFFSGFLPKAPLLSRETIAGVVPLAVVLIIAVLVVNSGILSRSDAGVAGAPDSRLVGFGPPSTSAVGAADEAIPDSVTDSFGPAVIDAVVPDQDIWTVVAGMNRPRQRHGSVSLRDGRVLVFGGFDTSGPVLTTEIYDPDLDSWTTVGDFPYALPNFNLPVVLDDGRVLVAGGSSALRTDPVTPWFLRVSALFNPATETWEPIEDFLSFGRRDTNLMTMPDGRVLLYGGAAGRIPNFPREEVFDPITGQWSRANKLSDFSEEYLSWVETVNAVTVVWGRYAGDGEDRRDQIPDDLVIPFNPDTRWTLLADVSANFGSPFAAELSNGRILVGTGSLKFGATGQTYFFDADPGISGPANSSGLDADNRDLRILATGDGFVQSVAEWWQDPRDISRQAMRTLQQESSAWTLIGEFPVPTLDDFSVTQIGNDRILITGGQLGSGNSGRYSDASYILQLPSD